MNTKNVLVVEDEISISKLCERVLNGEEFRVDIAGNGKIAQDMLCNLVDSNQYELCLIDIRTPEMNGIELYGWIADYNPRLANRVIFTTGSVMQQDIMDFIEQSGQPCLSKPYTPTALRTIVKDTLKEAE